MTVAVLGIDLAKRVFQLHGIDTRGRAVVSRRIGRSRLVETVVQLAPAVIAMEACCGAHHWGRRFRDLGIEVRLIHARFVRPYVKSAKNDARDAEAICEAAQRPHMRFVPIKSIEQQDIQALHRAREQVMRWRTALINHTRGLLEYGIALPQGPTRFRQEVTIALDDPSAELTPLVIELFHSLVDQLRALEDRLASLDRRVVALCRQNELSPACRAAWGRTDRRHGSGCQCWRRTPVPLRSGSFGLDRAGAATILERWQAQAPGYRWPGQPLPAQAAHPRRPLRAHASRRQDRSAEPMARSASGSPRVQPCRGRAGQQDGPGRLGPDGARRDLSDGASGALRADRSARCEAVVDGVTARTTPSEPGSGDGRPGRGICEAKACDFHHGQERAAPAIGRIDSRI